MVRRRSTVRFRKGAPGQSPIAILSQDQWGTIAGDGAERGRRLTLAITGTGTMGMPELRDCAWAAARMASLSSQPAQILKSNGLHGWARPIGQATASKRRHLGPDLRPRIRSKTDGFSGSRVWFQITR